MKEDLSPAAQMVLDVWSLMVNRLKVDERQRVCEIIGGFGPPEKPKEKSKRKIK